MDFVLQDVNKLKTQVIFTFVYSNLRCKVTMGYITIETEVTQLGSV